MTMTIPQPCQATTQSGRSCTVRAQTTGGLCHLHNPDRRCGVRKSDGSHCTQLAGSSGFCWTHLPSATPAPTSSASYGAYDVEPPSPEAVVAPAVHVTGLPSDGQAQPWALVVHSGGRRWIYPAASRSEAVTYLASGQFAPSSDDRMLFEVVPAEWVAHLPSVEFTQYDSARLHAPHGPTL